MTSETDLRVDNNNNTNLKKRSNPDGNLDQSCRKSMSLDNGTKATNITYQRSLVDKKDRLKTYQFKSQSGCTIWFTGLSSSGKTTISFALEDYLVKNKQITTYCLDGDNIRHGLNSNLGFSPDDRTENIRRIGEVAKLFSDCGIVCLTAFISPFEEDRQRVRQTHLEAGIKFIEVFVKTPLDVCEARDAKGLYKKAREGVIKEFTGISSPYEEPTQPELVLDTTAISIEESVNTIVNYLEDHGIMKGINQPINPIYELNHLEMISRELFVNKNETTYLRNQAANLEKLSINKIELQWVQVLSEGWAYPLTGFMREDEYLQTLHFNSIKKDDKKYNQSIPIVLSCTDSQKEKIIDKQMICLSYEGKDVAVLKNISIYQHRKEERCCRQFGIYNEKHPYQEYIQKECGDWLIGGDLEVFERIKWNDGLDQYRYTPVELREKFKEIKADAVFAFQLRNPIHNGHALLMKDTRKFLSDKGYKNPVLLLHPLGGWTKNDDVPLNVRIQQHNAVLEDGTYLDKNSTIMAIFPSPMMYAGPTEVQWHAKARMNAGAEYYIVGRDPAGMPHPDTKKDIYDPTHGSRVLQMAPGLENLQIVPFRVAAYNKTLKKMDYFNPKQADNFEFISGTKMRGLARDGKLPPNGFMADKAWEILANYYGNLSK